MASCFHLVPKDPAHGSWQHSITTKAVFIIANDEIEARRRVADSLYNTKTVWPTRGRYERIMPPPSPWSLVAVTSCQEDTSGACHHGDHVVADDGEKWPTKY
jgi:hypothetical protein